MESAGLELSRTLLLQTHRLARPAFNQLSYQDRCVPNDCSCGTKVDAQGLHGFSCKKGARKHIRHSLLNDTVWHSFLRAKIQVQKEPAGLSVLTRGQNGLRLIPWKRDRSVTWDVTVADTFATSYLPLTSLEAGSAAERAASLKNKKYEELARITTFSHFHSAGLWGHEHLVLWGYWLLAWTWWPHFRSDWWQARIHFSVSEVVCGALEGQRCMHNWHNTHRASRLMLPDRVFLFVYFTLILSFFIPPLV